MAGSLGLRATKDEAPEPAYVDMMHGLPPMHRLKHESQFTPAFTSLDMNDMLPGSQVTFSPWDGRAGGEGGGAGGQ